VNADEFIDKNTVNRPPMPPPPPEGEGQPPQRPQRPQGAQGPPVRMKLDKHQEYHNLKESRDKVFKEPFWLELWKRLGTMYRRESYKCETKKDDMRYFQGRVSVFLEILGDKEREVPLIPLPDRIIREYQDKLLD